MTAAETEPEIPVALGSPQRPRPNTLTASAARLTSRNIKRFQVGKGGDAEWQAETWEMFDLVGELHFLVSTLANRVGQAKLFAAILPDDPLDDPEPINSDNDVAEGEAPNPERNSALAKAAAAAFDAWGNTPANISQMLTRGSANLSLPGDGWFVGIPKDKISPPEVDDATAARTLIKAPTLLRDGEAEEPVEGIDLDTLVWRFMSRDEVSIKDDVVTLVFDESDDNDRSKIEVKPDECFMVRVWKASPRKWWRADSATKACLPVLRELVGLTMHTSAQIDSRLAGAGVFLVPQSAKDAIKAHMDPNPDNPDDDPFTEALMEAMLTPIGDRSNASALVPLILGVPDDTIEKFRHISFASELDTEARPMRGESIDRLALGMDTPPEVLTGVGGMNHWGAWLVKEDVVTTHVEPPLALMCDALTTQYLWPVLLEQGFKQKEVERAIFWYSVDHLISRPNKLDDAVQLSDRGAINDKALRREGGFTEEDAPETDSPVDTAITLAVELVKGAPSLAGDPGLPALVEQLRSVLGGEVPQAEDNPEDETDSETGGDDGGTPDTAESPAEPDDAAVPAAASVTRSESYVGPRSYEHCGNLEDHVPHPHKEESNGTFDYCRGTIAGVPEPVLA